MRVAIRVGSWPRGGTISLPLAGHTLRFLRHEASVSEIYGRMKHAVRRELQNREWQRIQALNDRERRRMQLEPSPEAALEAKLDRMPQNNDNVPEEEEEGLSKNQLERGREFTQTV